MIAEPIERDADTLIVVDNPDDIGSDFHDSKVQPMEGGCRPIRWYRLITAPRHGRLSGGQFQTEILAGYVHRLTYLVHLSKRESRAAAIRRRLGLDPLEREQEHIDAAVAAIRAQLPERD